MSNHKSFVDTIDHRKNADVIYANLNTSPNLASGLSIKAKQSTEKFKVLNYNYYLID